MTVRRMFCVLLCVGLLLTLCGCGGTEEKNAQAEPAATATVPGYIPSRIAMPSWLNVNWYSSGLSFDGDWIWFGGRSPEMTFVIAGYDTVADSWRRIDADLSGVRNPDAGWFSRAGNSLWCLLHEGVTYEQVSRGEWPDDLGYYVLRVDLESGEASCARVPLEGGRGSEGSNLIFTGLLGLDDGRALLAAPDAYYLIDAAVNVLAQPALPFMGDLRGFAVNGTRYLWTQDGYAPFDTQTLTLGAPLDAQGLGGFSSNNGHFFVSRARALCDFDPATGAAQERFRWMDVALSIRDLGSWTGMENSEGNFFYCGQQGLIKVTPGQVPVRKPLYLGCFGTSDDRADAGAYFMTMELQDAVIRFNNTDPEYKIEVKPLIYTNESERDRLLIEIATGSGLDLLDTSWLPESAVDEGLFVDMLPWLDADETFSREDFIPSLFSLLLKNGGLYEYTDKFTMVTMLTHADLFPGREAWTVEGMESLIAAHPEMEPLWHSMDRDMMLTLFAWAATAEFIDWDAMTCSFDSPAFIHWLELLKALPPDGEYSEAPRLLDVSYDYAMDAGFSARYALKDDYAVAGFPETAGTGSYFLKLGSSVNDWRGTVGQNTRLGILASGQDHAAAWRFLRTLMLGEDEPSISMGIPVLRARFEQALADAITNRHDERFDIDEFNEADAARLREQVYNSAKLIHTDEELLRVIYAEANAFFAGQKSAEEAARQIQSRLSLYLAEKS